MDIVKAKIEETGEIIDFYYKLIDDMETAEFDCKWQKDVYPTREYIAAAIKEGTLYIGKDENGTMAAMILNHHYEEAYRNCSWKVNVPDEELLVIHTLAISVKAHGKGYGKQMVRFAQECARKMQCRAMRLDVLEGNLPAEKLYPSVGFEFIGKTKIYYEDTGLANFLLFEYLI